MKLNINSVARFLLATATIATAIVSIANIYRGRQRLSEKRILKHEKLVWEGEGGNVATPAVTSISRAHS